MARNRTRLLPAAFALAAVAALATTSGAAPAAAEPSGYPSWQDVQQAKSDTAAAQAEVDKITGLLSGLQSAADAAGITSQIAAEKALRAQAAAHDAAVKLSAAKKSEQAAAAKAALSRTRAGLLAAGLARGADGDLATQLLLNGDDADDLLNRLSSVSQLSAQTAQIYAQAVADDRTVAAQRDQVDAASTALTAVQQSADQAAAAAKSTADAAEAAVKAQQVNQTRLVAQLADLQNTSDEEARQYAQGVEVRRQQAAAAAAAAAAKSAQTGGSSGGAASSGGGTSGGTTSGGTGSSSSGSPAPVRAPNGSLAAAAVAFARAHIGDAYVFAGAGPTVWDCSGLTMQAYASVGIGIGGHSATAQYDQAQANGQLVPYGDAEPGDLVFYTDGGGDMYHVAIYSGGGMMIEAPYEGVPVREVAVRSYQLVDEVARPTS